MADNQQQPWRPRGRGNQARGRGNRGGNWNRGSNQRDQGSNPVPDTQEAPQTLEVFGENLPLAEIYERLGELQKLKQEKEKEKVKKDTRILIHTTFAIPDTLLKGLEALYPNHRFVCDKPYAPQHDHPYVAIERQIAEESMLHRLSSKNVLSVYGNPGRMKKLKHENVWCCIPVDEPIDCISRFWADNVKDAKFCEHNKFKCSCINPDAFICMYRAQEWTPDDVIQMLDRTTDKVGIIAIRHFSDLVGSLCRGEITYTRDESTVKMSVAGDTKTYELADGAFWFMTNYYDSGQSAFAWEQIDRFGDTRVILVKKAKVGLKATAQPPIMGLLQSIHKPEFFGQLTYDLRGNLAKDPALHTVINTLNLEQAKAFSIYNWILFHYQTTDKKIYVPKGVVDEVRLFVGLRPRDSSLFASAAEKAKKSCIRFNIPTEMIPESATACAILGFFTDVDTEKQLLMPALYDQTPIRDLNSLLTFLPKWYFPTKTVAKAALHLIPIVALLITIAVTYWQKRNLRKQIDHSKTLFTTATKSDAISAIGGLLEGLRSLLPWLKSQYMNWISIGTRHVLRWASYSFRINTKACLLHAPITRQDVCMDGHPLPKMHPTAKVRLPLDYVDCQPKHGTTQFGFGTNIRIPVVARSCVHNELIAVVARGCLDRPVPQPGVWEEMVTVLQDILPPTESRYYRNGRLHAPLFNIWVARFPPKRRQELINAKSQLANGMRWLDLVKAFVKREKQLKSYPESTNTQHLAVEQFAPRIISGRTPMFQVVTGPITYSMTKQIAWMWNQDVSHGVEMEPNDPRPRTCIIYTSGLNAEDLGSSFEFHLSRLSNIGEIMFKEEDQSRFDAHCGIEAVALILLPYKTHNAPPKAIEPLTRLAFTKGVTQHGIHYSIEATVKSGDGNTSSGDSTTVGTAKEAQRRKARIPKEHIVTWNTGDDVLSIYLMTYDKVYTPIVDDHWRDLGFSAKIHTFTSAYDAEYCSGRFWPTHDGIVFGPKPGRILSKTFHSMIEYNEHMGRRWLLTVAKGLHRDTHFLPIVRTVIEITLQLMSGMKEIVIREEEKIHAMRFHEPCVETYLMYDHLYGLSKTMCDEVEDYLRKEVRSLPCTVNHEYINMILEVDCPEDDLPRRSEITKASILYNSNSDIYYIFAAACIMMNPHGAPALPFLLDRDAFQHDILVPIIEEMLKAHSPLIAYGLPVLELSSYLIANLTKGTNFNPWPAFCVHIFTHMLGKSAKALIARIAFHSLFNSLMTHMKHSAPKASALNGFLQAIIVYHALCFVLEDAVPALWGITTRLWNKLMHALRGNMNNYKGELQTLCQKWGLNVPIYSADSSGTPHNPVHTVKCVVNGNGVSRAVTTSSTTMKAAEQSSAQRMIEYMTKNESEFRGGKKIEKEDDLQLLMQSMSHDFTYDSLYIDADNVKAPPLSVEPQFIAHETFFAGVCTSLTQWESYIDHWSPHFGDVSEKIVESTPDAADNAMVKHMSQNLKKSMALLTRDQKFIKQALAVAISSLTVASTLPELPALSVQKMQLVLNTDTIVILNRLFAKYSGVENKPRSTQTMFKSFI